MFEDASETDIAIIGMAGRYPNSPDLGEFWRKLCAGEEFATFLTEDEARALGLEEALINDPHYIRASGLLATTEYFDAAFFGYNPKEAGFMDPQQRHFLEVAWEALEDAGYDADRLKTSVSVFGGSAMDTYSLLNIASNPHLMTFPNKVLIQVGNDNSYLTTRVSYKLNLKGPSHTVQCACSTSLVATHLACQSLLNEESDMALVGGSTVHAQGRTGYPYLEGGVASPDGHCRTFDAQGKGPIFNNGVAAIVLKRLTDALADRDHIYAVIKGSAINNDGSLKVSYAAPSIAGQAAVIAEALAVADMEAETITYVEAHGTATPLGDPIEVSALTQVYRASTDRKQFCGIGSVKSNVGHLDAAAGVTGIIKTSLALTHKMIPASLHFNQPNPNIDFNNSPFRVITELTPWPTGPTPRRAGVSSFGIGGTNAHAILQEAPPVGPGSPSRPVQLLVLSARTETALETATTNLVRHLQHHPDVSLTDAAYTLQTGRKTFDHRRVILGRDVAEVAQATEAPAVRRMVTGISRGIERPVVFMFSGQGSQYPHMATELYEAEPTFHRIVDECCDLLAPHLDLDLRTLLLPKVPSAQAAEQLQQTWITQPALFVIEYALARLWMEWGIQPAAMVGHSIGEYVAACVAGVFSLPDALKLVATRGRLVQALPRGTMLALPLSEAAIAPLLGESLSVAAVNESSRCVVSGSDAAIQALEARLSEQGIEGRRLHTSHAFHSHMMDPILEPLAQQVSAIQRHAPQIPFISNVTGTWITAEQAIDPVYWTQHLRQAVRFADGLGTLMETPNRILLEVGPGRTLVTLANRHPAKADDQLILASLCHADDKASNEEFLLRSLGQLWLAGVAVNWAGFYTHEQRSRVSLPTYPFERQRYWIEPGTPSPEEGGDRQAALPTKKQDVAEWFSIPSWRRTMPPTAAPPPVPDGAWMLFADGCGLGASLARRLEQAGEDVIVVAAGAQFANEDDNAYTIQPDQSGDYDALLRAVVHSGKSVSRIVHLWSVTAPNPDATPLEQAATFGTLGFYSLLSLAQALGRQGGASPVQMRVVSNNMQAVTNEATLYPAKATLLGPCKVIPQEYENIVCQSIDVVLPEPGTWQAEQLVEQLLIVVQTQLADPIIAYRGDDRWVPSYQPTPLAGATTPAATRLREGGVYLITGGLGGIGLELAQYLAHTAKARLLLTSRTAFPPRAEWERWLADGSRASAAQRDQILRIQELETLGAEVLVLEADVTQLAPMQAVVRAALDRYGALHGVLHAAGIPGGGIIQLKKPEAAASVLAPKVTGTLVLNEALKGIRLDFLFLFSSITAITGGFGQVDYCAANTFLDAFAHANRAERGVFTVSINWDAWQTVGMAANTQALRAFPSVVDQPVAHPLLERYRQESEEQARFTTEFSARKHWVLSEHYVMGKPTIPGSTYPEMAHAAWLHHTGNPLVEIQDLLFVTPFMVGEEESKAMVVTLDRRGDGWEFHARSSVATGNGDGPRWQDHASGTLRAFAPQASKAHDLAAMIARCVPVDIEAVRGAAGMAQFVDTGPRWDCIRAVYAGTREGVAVLELSEAFAADLEQHQLHPTLMDIATAFAIQAVGEGNYLPLAYNQVRVHGPLRGKIYCYVRVPDADVTSKETVEIDVLIMDERGLPLVDIQGFSVKRVSEDATKRLLEAAARASRAEVSPNANGPHAAAGSDPAAARDSFKGLRDPKDAILPEEGVEAFARILAQNQLPQIIVSSRDLQATIDEINAFNPRAVMEGIKAAPLRGRTQTHPRPTLGVSYVAPTSDTEQQIANVWQEVLGIDQIGIHDNFFELGGDSMLGTQVMAKAKEFGLDVTAGQFFQYQTIAELGALIDELLAQQGGGPSVPVPALVSIMEEEQLLATLDQLSEAEMDVLLAQMATEQGNGA